MKQTDPQPLPLENLKWDSDMHGIRAFQTLRGTVEQGDAYSQWNLCDYTNDDAARVFAARQRLCLQLSIGLRHLVMPRQRHTTRVAIIDELYLRTDDAARLHCLDGIDALVTALPGICIGVNTADCVPIVLADPSHGVVAVAHAGWRGTVAGIPRNTIDAMLELGAQPAQIHATMGASICADCFEVGDEVVEAFAQAGFELAAIMRRHPSTGKAHIDLQQANRQSLIAAGLLAQHITLPTTCSRCHSDRYFSARRLGIDSGRTFTCVLRST